MKKEFKTLSDKIIEDGFYIINHKLYVNDVKEFIKETLDDIEGGYEGVELMERIKKRAGEKLIK